MFMIVIVLVALVIAAVWYFRRRSRSTQQTPPRRLPSAPQPPGRARPKQIWWADVPFSDGSDSKVRPCLVVGFNSRNYRILKITSQDYSHRDDHLEIPTKEWDPKAKSNSFVDLRPILLNPSLFKEQAGELDDRAWKKVQRLKNT